MTKIKVPQSALRDNMGLLSHDRFTRPLRSSRLSGETVRTNTRIRLLLTGLMLLNNIAAAQTIYEWHGDNNERNFSDLPPNNVDATATNLSATPTNEAEIEQRLATEDEARAAKVISDEVNRETAAAAAEEAAQRKAQRSANCARARQIQKKYNSNRRIYEAGPDGEPTKWLDIDEERSKAQKNVDTWCD